MKDNITDRSLIVCIKTQQLCFFINNKIQKKYIISTALRGIGNEENSYQTPLDYHTISAKYGKKAPLFTIFKARQNTGEIYKFMNNEKFNTDMILTRILRLKGEKQGINKGFNSSNKCVDSFKRYIYIHGTNREDLLGTPSSIGCIRMKNIDIVELFDNVEIGTKVYIKESLY